MPALPIYTTSAMRKLEELAAPASGTLMERAGAAAAEHARSLCGDTAKSVLVLAGPGNNGGDAFEVATHLKRWFFRESATSCGKMRWRRWENGKPPEERSFTVFRENRASVSSSTACSASGSN